MSERNRQQGDASGIEFRPCRHRGRLRRAEARRDNGNRDGPTDRERQPRGASLACHLSSQPPRGDTPVPEGAFRIKAYRAVKNGTLLPLNALFLTASANPVLSPHQSGFRFIGSTISAITFVAIAVDHTEAFNSVDHCLLFIHIKPVAQGSIFGPLLFCFVFLLVCFYNRHT